MSNPLKKVSKLLHHHKDKENHHATESGSESPRESIASEHRSGVDTTLSPSNTMDSRHSTQPASPTGSSTPVHHKPSLVERMLPGHHKKASPASSVHEEHSHEDSEEAAEKKRSKLEAKLAKNEKAREEHDAVVARHDEAYKKVSLVVEHLYLLQSKLCSTGPAEYLLRRASHHSQNRSKT